MQTRAVKMAANVPNIKPVSRNANGMDRMPDPMEPFSRCVSVSLSLKNGVPQAVCFGRVNCSDHKYCQDLCTYVVACSLFRSANGSYSMVLFSTSFVCDLKVA